MEKPTLRKLVQLGVLCLLISQQAGCTTPASPVVVPPTATPTPTRSPSPRQTETAMRDITYCTPDGMGIKMDLYLPPKTDAEPSPVVLWVHGGSWSSGDKSTGDGVADANEFLKRGYALASIDYRHAPTFKFPAQIEDVKCAVRYLRAKAADYDIDPQRIGAWGSSAGGHLVALLGVTDANAGLEGNGGYADQSSRVQAVVDMFGRSDLTMTFNDRMAQMAQDVFGAKSAQDPILVRASPVTYITPDDPPFLILHGEKDDVVPPIHSQVLYDKLKAAGVPATLVMVKNAGHGFASVGGVHGPSLYQDDGSLPFLGTGAEFARRDPVSLASTVPITSLEKLQIWLDAGQDDPWIEQSTLLHGALTSRGIAHTWQVYPGGHDYDYWRGHVLD